MIMLRRIVISAKIVTSVTLSMVLNGKWKVKDLKFFNLDKQWWAINWRKDEQGDNIPVLKYYDRIKFTFD